MSKNYDKIVDKYILSIYGEPDLIPEKIIQFVFNGKSIAELHIPNMIYPNKHINIEIRHGSWDFYM